MGNLKTFFTAKINIGENISLFNTRQLKLVRRLSILVLLMLVTGGYLYLSSLHALSAYFGGHYVLTYLVGLALLFTFSSNKKNYTLIPFIPDWVRKVLTAVLAFYGQIVALVLMPGTGYFADQWVFLVWFLLLIMLRFNIMKLYNSVPDKSILG